MPKFNFHMGITLRCYGNVEIEADSIETALPMLTADFVGDNIDITETTTDSGQDLAVIDVSDADTGEEFDSYAGESLPSPYDPPPGHAELLAALKWAVGMAEEAVRLREESDDPDDTEEMTEAHRAELANALAVIAEAEGRANG